jgi:crotonobetainyl-CoA:carnitine CoA-transferase CaiB-like acyl-CoA transferase
VNSVVLARADVPVAQVVSLAEAATGPRAAARGFVAGPPGEEQVVFPVLRDGRVPGRYGRRPPRLGEHTDEVLNTAGP